MGRTAPSNSGALHVALGPFLAFRFHAAGVHEDNSAAWGQSLLQRATELVPELSTAGARVESVQVSYRPWPQVY